MEREALDLTAAPTRLTPTSADRRESCGETGALANPRRAAERRGRNQLSVVDCLSTAAERCGRDPALRGRFGTRRSRRTESHRAPAALDMSCAYVRSLGLRAATRDIRHLGNAILCTQPSTTSSRSRCEPPRRRCFPGCLAIRADWHADRVLCERTIRPRNDHARRRHLNSSALPLTGVRCCTWPRFHREAGDFRWRLNTTTTELADRRAWCELRVYDGSGPVPRAQRHELSSID